MSERTAIAVSEPTANSTSRSGRSVSQVRAPWHETLVGGDDSDQRVPVGRRRIDAVKPQHDIVDRAHRLNNINHRGHGVRRGDRPQRDRLRPDAEDGAITGAGQSLKNRCRRAQRRTPQHLPTLDQSQHQGPVDVLGLYAQQIDRRRANELRHEDSRRPVIDRLRRANLNKITAVHDADTVRQHQRFRLIMCHVDRRHRQRLVQFLQLGARTLAQLQIEIAQRLVHQEDIGPADKRPAQCHTLALAAR